MNDVSSAIFAQDVFTTPSVEWWSLSPIIALVSGVLLLLVVGALTPVWPRNCYAFFTASTAAVAGGLAMMQWDDISDEGASTLMRGALAFDTLAQFLTITVCAATLLVALITGDELRRANNDGPEVYALFLTAATGAVVMGAANDLIVLFLGLETLSLALYVLAASDRERSATAVPEEAATRTAPTRSAGVDLRGRGGADAGGGAAGAAGGDLRGTATTASGSARARASHARATGPGLARAAWRRA